MKRIVRRFLKRINYPSAYTQFSLGVDYATGEGVKRDSQKAFVCFTKSASKGNVYAQFNLALMYYQGRLGLQKATSRH